MSRFEKIVEGLARHFSPKTTEQVHAAQMEHHKAVNEIVKRTFPYPKVHEWREVYKALGEEPRFQLMVTYVRIIVLNESEHREWFPIYEEVMGNDKDFSEWDHDVFVEIIYTMQERNRALVGGRTVLASHEVEAARASFTDWKLVHNPSLVSDPADQDEEVAAWLSLESLGKMVREMDEEKADAAHREEIERLRRRYVSPDELRSYILALGELEMKRSEGA